MVRCTDAFDERWRQVARFRENDSSPKEEFVHHQAGIDGRGGSSYIDLLAFRNKDANTLWTSASDGTLEERIYYCQDWRSDVSALVTSTGNMKEWVKYSTYGTPFGLPGGDTDSDGDCDTGDTNQVQTWINGSAYDVRGDVDLDGDVDTTDKSTILASFSGVTLGRGTVSAIGTGNRTGYAGYEHWSVSGLRCDARNRILASDLGKWMTRDPIKQQRASLYELDDSSPVRYVDPMGLSAVGSSCADGNFRTSATVVAGDSDKGSGTSVGGTTAAACTGSACIEKTYFLGHWIPFGEDHCYSPSTIMFYIDPDDVIVCCRCTGDSSSNSTCKWFALPWYTAVFHTWCTGGCSGGTNSCTGHASVNGSEQTATSTGPENDFLAKVPKCKGL